MPLTLSQLVADPGFQSLSPADQDSLRLEFLRRYVLPDQGYRALSNADKADIANQVMAVERPSLFRRFLAAVPTLAGGPPPAEEVSADIEQEGIEQRLVTEPKAAIAAQPARIPAPPAQQGEAPAGLTITQPTRVAASPAEGQAPQARFGLMERAAVAAAKTPLGRTLGYLGRPFGAPTGAEVTDIEKEMGRANTLVDRTFEMLGTLVPNLPLYVVGGGVAGAATQAALRMGMARLLTGYLAKGISAELAAQMAAYAVSASKTLQAVVGAGSAAGAFATPDAVQEVFEEVERGEFSPTKIVAAGAKGAAVGAPVGVVGSLLVARPVLKLLAETGALAGGQAIIKEGRLPTVQELVDSGIQLTIIQAAFRLAGLRFPGGPIEPEVMPPEQRPAITAGAPPEPVTIEVAPEVPQPPPKPIGPPPGEAPATPMALRPAIRRPMPEGPQAEVPPPGPGPVAAAPPVAEGLGAAPVERPSPLVKSGEDLIRGSSNIPLSDAGKAQVASLAQRFKAKGGVDAIVTSDLERAEETAKTVSDATGAPIEQATDGLHPWRLGEIEGKPTRDVLNQMTDLVKERPDEAPTGRGPRSVHDGESFNTFKDRFLGYMRGLMADWQQNPEKILAVTHYRGVKALQAWIADGTPDDLAVNTKEMLRHDGEPGDVYRFAPTKDGPWALTKIDMASDKALEPGIYVMRHGLTEWNRENAGAAGQAEVAGPQAIPQRPAPSRPQVPAGAQVPLIGPTIEDAARLTSRIAGEAAKWEAEHRTAGGQIEDLKHEQIAPAVDLLGRARQYERELGAGAGAVALRGAASRLQRALERVLPDDLKGAIFPIGVERGPSQPPQTPVQAIEGAAAAAHPAGAPRPAPGRGPRPEVPAAPAAVAPVPTTTAPTAAGPEPVTGPPATPQGAAAAPAQVGPPRRADQGPLAEVPPTGLPSPGAPGEGRPVLPRPAGPIRRPAGGLPSGRPELGAGERTPEPGVLPAERGGPAGPRGEPEPTGEPAPILSTPEKPASDYIITDADHIGEGTETEKFQANVAAIRALKQIEAEGRLATPDEQKILVRYVGWGGMKNVFDRSLEYYVERDQRRTEYARYQKVKEALTDEEWQEAAESVLNAHYTSIPVVRGIWDALERLGIKNLRGNILLLEPAVGVGHFFGAEPTDLAARTTRVGVDKDAISARIAKQLYQAAQVIHSPYEKAPLADNFFDVAISNVPFAEIGVFDPAFKAKPLLTASLHNYFFVKALEQIRPGGVIAFITSRYTMDGAKWQPVREYLASKADLLGAIRLPKTAFEKTAGTEVVTDIIFLEKRREGAPAVTQRWAGVSDVVDEAGVQEHGAKINEYFREHPEMVLGRHAFTGSMYGRAEYTVEPDGRDLPTALKGAVERLPDGVIQPIRRKAPPSGVSIPAPGDVPELSFTMREGKPFQRIGGKLLEVTGEPGIVAKVKGLIGLRDTWRQLISKQLNPTATEEEIASLRQELGRIYDAFVKSHGPLHAKANRRSAFREDPEFHSLLAIEKWDREAAKAEKSDIFSRRTIKPQVQLQAADTAKDAMLASLNELSRVDLDRIAELIGKKPEEARAELQGLVFDNPGGALETADEYLSGNVRAKLAAAKAAAATEHRYQENVAALEKVQPEDVRPQAITVRLGSPWVPVEIYRDFVAHILDLRGIGNRQLSVNHIDALALWRVRAPYVPPEAASRWGTSDFDPHQLIEDAMNFREPTVWRTEGDPPTRTVDQVATIAAKEKIWKLQEEFKRWTWSDPERTADLARLYNDTMNNTVPRSFDGSHLTLPGSSPIVTLRKHQLDTIWRGLQGGNLLVAHEVGTGKSWVLAGIAFESKRLGLRNKPMVVVPNNTLQQFPEQFLSLYPSAKLLVAVERDLSPERRQEFLGKIATGDWDAVVVAQSQFGMIDTSNETKQAFYREQIEALENYLLALEEEARQRGGGFGRRGRKDITVRELEKAKGRLELRLQKLVESAKKDEGLTWEKLGVDLLLVDEAHAYKRLYFPTKLTRVKGVPTGNDALRAMDMYLKTRWITKVNNGSGVVFATGTPLTNTIAEIYNYQRYLQAPALEQVGISHFDAWAHSFGDMVTALEYGATGKAKLVSRFGQFSNLPELVNMLRANTDVMFARDAGIEVPKSVVSVIKSPATPELKAYIQSLDKRAEALKGKPPGLGADNILVINTDGRKAAIDLRLVNPSALDHPENKTNKAAENIYRIWKETGTDKGTQLVFLDMSAPTSTAKGGLRGFSVYKELKAKLINLGVPQDEIAFIHDFSGDDRPDLFERVNRGEVRVLIGSTEKMGLGMNVQQRVAALHHLDVPWRPDQLEQRNGRAIRQGNSYETVHVYPYITAGSYDAVMWQAVENKLRGIHQLLQGGMTDRTAEDIAGDVILNPTQMKAIATGNPRVLEKVMIDSQVQKYEALEAAHLRERQEAEYILASSPAQAETYRKHLESSKADVARYGTNKPAEGQFAVMLGGKPYTDRVEAGERLIAEIQAIVKTNADHEGEIGNYAGFPVVVSYAAGDRPILTTALKGETQNYPFQSRELESSDKGIERWRWYSPAGTVRSLEMAGKNGPPASLRFYEELTGKETGKVTWAETILRKPFEYAEKLDELRQKREALSRELQTDQQSMSEDDAHTIMGESGGETGAEPEGGPAQEPGRRIGRRADTFLPPREGEKPEPADFFAERVVPAGAHAAPGFGRPAPGRPQRREGPKYQVELPENAPLTKFQIDQAQRWRQLLRGTTLPEIVDWIKTVFAAGHISPASAVAAGVVREGSAQLQRATDMADAAVGEMAYELAPLPLAKQLEFTDDAENGRPHTDPRHNAIEAALQAIFDDRLAKVQARGKLQEAIVNYMPHIWDPDDLAVAKSMYAAWAARRPLRGSRDFLKHRSLPKTIDGVFPQGAPTGWKEMDNDTFLRAIEAQREAARRNPQLRSPLRPESWNPVLTGLAKIREMDKFLAGEREADWAKERGIAVFVPFGKIAPENWRPYPDSAFEVFGDPNIKIQEAFDAGIVEQLGKLATDLGISHQRLARIGGMGRWGYAQRGDGHIVTKFGGPESVIAHEIGHQIDWKFGLADKFIGRGPDAAVKPEVLQVRRELRALTDLTFEGLTPTPAFQRRARKLGEQMANMIEAYVHAKEKFKEVAPHVYTKLENLLSVTPRLRPLMDIKPTMVLGTAATTVNAGGLLKHGQYYGPPESVRIFERYLAPGGGQYALYRGLRLLGNAMTRAKIAGPGFHAMFEVIEASWSRAALALQQASRGQFAEAAKSLAVSAVPGVAAASAVLRGRPLYRAWSDPSVGNPEVEVMLGHLMRGGQRGQMDTALALNAAKAFRMAIAEAKTAKALWFFPWAALDRIGAPLMHWMVPHLKLGGGAQLMDFELSKLPPGATDQEFRDVAMRVSDTIDDRLGQMVRDNITLPAAMRDSLLLAMLSFTWRFGGVRAFGGGIYDWTKMAVRAARGQSVELTPRMAYTIMGPLLTALWSYLASILLGFTVERVRDLVYPQTPWGRVALQTYLKDVYPVWEAAGHRDVRGTGQAIYRYLRGSTSPLARFITEVLENEDYLGGAITDWRRSSYARIGLDIATHFGRQFVPIAVGQAMASRGEGRSLMRRVLPAMGFPPAPKWVERPYGYQGRFEQQQERRSLRLKRQRETGTGAYAR